MRKLLYVTVAASALAGGSAGLLAPPAQAQLDLLGACLRAPDGGPQSTVPASNGLIVDECRDAFGPPSPPFAVTPRPIDTDPFRRMPPNSTGWWPGGLTEPRRLEAAPAIASPQIVIRHELDPASAIDAEDRFASTAYILVKTPDGVGACTGTLINARQILTAGHCFSPDVTDVKVHFGPNAHAPDEVVFAQSVAIHEDWPLAGETGFEIYNGTDVAVITLARPVVAIASVVLDDAQGTATFAALGNPVFFAGYGKIGDGLVSLPSDGLRRFTRNVIDLISTTDEVLADSLPPDHPWRGAAPLLFHDFDSEPPADGVQLGGPALPDEGSTEQGDSGGPVFAETPDGLVQIGITSGYLPAFDLTPGYGELGISVPVYLYRDWIDAASPYLITEWLGGPGLWSDTARWTAEAAPMNLTGPFSIGYGPAAPVAVQVRLGQAGTVKLDMDAMVDAIALDHADARLEVGAGRTLAALADIFVVEGELAIDGRVLSSRLFIDGGEVSIGETGAYVDGSQRFDGGVTISGGRLHVAGLVDTQAFDILGGAVQVADSGYVYDRDGTIQQGGRLEVDGVWDTGFLDQLGGELVLSETGYLFDYSGFTLLAGEVEIEGLLDTLTVLQVDGRVSGSGVIYAPDGYIHAAGTLEAGGRNWRDTLLVGDYLAGPDARLRLRADAGGSTVLNVFGDAVLDGTTIEIVAPSGLALERGAATELLVADSLTIIDPLQLDAAPISAMLSFSLAADADTLWLEVNAADFSDFARTRAAQSVARALDGAMSGYAGALPEGAFGDMVFQLDAIQAEADLSATLDAMSPSATFTADSFAFELGRILASVRPGADLYSARRTGRAQIQVASLDDARWPSASGQARVRAFLQTGRASTPPAGYDGSTRLKTGYLLAGVEAAAAPGLSVGAAASLAQSESSAGAGAWSGDMHALQGFAAYSGGVLNASFQAGYGWIDHAGTRSVSPASPGLMAAWDASAELAFAAAEVSARFGAGRLQGGPVLRASASRLDMEAYEETGAGVWSARIDARERDFALIEAGGELILAGTGAAPGEAYLRVMQVSQIAGRDATAEATLAGLPTGTGFQVDGLGGDENWTSLAAGFEAPVVDRWRLGVGLESDLGRNNAVQTQLRFTLGARF